MGFPLRDTITGGYPTIMKFTFFAFIVKENKKYISDKKQITYILTQNGIAIPVHLKFFRVYMFLVLFLSKTSKGTCCIWFIVCLEGAEKTFACKSMNNGTKRNRHLEL